MNFGIYFAIGSPVRPRATVTRKWARFVCGPFALFIARFDLDRAFCHMAIELDKVNTPAPAPGQEGPCHEPQGLVFRSAEEVFKHYGVTLADDGHEPFEPQPDPTPDTCRWWKDEYGNWCCSCSDTLPDFTPWTGTDPNGCFCPNCGKIITVRVHDKP